MFNAFFKSVSVISRQPVHLSMLSWSFFNQYSAQYSSKPLVAFPHNHSRNNGQRGDRNESHRNDYQQSWEGYCTSRGSNQQPPVLKSCRLQTELWGSATTLEKKSAETIVQKGNNVFSAFSTVFSILSKKNFTIKTTLRFSSANDFYLEIANILLSGKELTNSVPIKNKGFCRQHRPRSDSTNLGSILSACLVQPKGLKKI